MASIGQNPAAQQMMAALMAHIAEHAAFAYRAQVELAFGAPLPALDETETAPISIDDEKALAPLIAAAAQRTMMQNQAQAAQMQAQQQAADPVLQMQQQELALKAQELQRKEADSVRDFQIGQQKLALERERLALDAQKEGARLQSQERQGDKRIRADIVKNMMKPQKPTPRPQ